MEPLKKEQTETVSAPEESMYPTEGINDEIIENIHENLDDNSKVNQIVDQVLGSKSTLETFVNKDRTDIDYSVFLESVELDEDEAKEGDEA